MASSPQDMMRVISTRRQTVRTDLGRRKWNIADLLTSVFVLEPSCSASGWSLLTPHAANAYGERHFPALPPLMIDGMLYIVQLYVNC